MGLVVCCAGETEGSMELRVSGLLLAAALLAEPRTGAQSAGVSVEKQIAAVFDGIGTDKTPGLAVLAKKNGNVLFERGYGLKEIRTNSKFKTKTISGLGSVTKNFPGRGVLLLVHKKKLNYE